MGGVRSTYRIRDWSIQLQFHRENRAILDIEVEPDRLLILNNKGWDRATGRQIVAVKGDVAESGFERHRYVSSILDERGINLEAIIFIEGLDLR